MTRSMQMALMRARLPRLFAIVLWAGVAALVPLVAMPLITAWHDWDIALAQKAERVQRARIALSHAAANPKAGPLDLADGRQLAHGGDGGAIDLQNRLQAAAQAAGVQVHSVEALPDRRDDALVLAGLLADLQGSAPAVQKVLHDLETGLPWIGVAGATLRPLPSGSSEAEPQLTLHLELRAAVLQAKAAGP